MNRKIAMSGLSIITALAMMGGSAFAAFTTTATATGNTFSTTNPSLTVSVNGAPAGSSVNGAVVTGLVPGVAGPAQNFVLNNTDTDPSATQALSLQLVNLPTNTLPGGDLTIVVTCVGEQPVSDSYANWIASAHSLGNLGPGASVSCTMTPTLNSGVGNGAAGKSAIFDAVFTGTIGS